MRRKARLHLAGIFASCCSSAGSRRTRAPTSRCARSRRRCARDPEGRTTSCSRSSAGRAARRAAPTSRGSWIWPSALGVGERVILFPPQPQRAPRRLLRGRRGRPRALALGVLRARRAGGAGVRHTGRRVVGRRAALRGRRRRDRVPRRRARPRRLTPSALLELLARSAASAAHGRSGRARTRLRFSWDAHGRECSDVYRELVRQVRALGAVGVIAGASGRRFAPSRRPTIRLIQRWQNDPEVWWLDGLRAPVLARGRRRERGRARSSEGHPFIIEADGRPIGRIGLNEFRARDRTCSLYVFIGEPDARGKGYGAEAVRRPLVGYAFDRMDLARIEAAYARGERRRDPRVRSVRVRSRRRAARAFVQGRPVRRSRDHERHARAVRRGAGIASRTVRRVRVRLRSARIALCSARGVIGRMRHPSCHSLSRPVYLRIYALTCGFASLTVLGAAGTFRLAPSSRSG